MAKSKKLTLSLDDDSTPNNSIVLLQSQFNEDYFVAYHLNILLELSFKQMDYHSIIEDETVWKFPLFQAYSKEWKEYFFLVRNESLSVLKQHSGGLFDDFSTKRLLLPKYPSFNFILVSTSKIPESFLLLLRQSRWMTAIKFIEISSINNPSNLIFEPVMPVS